MSQKARRTEEFHLKNKLEKETKMRRRKAVNKQKQGKQRPRGGCPRAAAPSPLMQELSSAKAASLREALLSVASSEEESEELHRIFNSLGASEPGSPQPAGHAGATGVAVDPPSFEAKIKLREATIDCKLHLLGGAPAWEERWVSQPISLEQSMPLGHKALEWLAKGGRCWRHPEMQDLVIGEGGCVLVFTNPELRKFLEARSCIGVAHLTSDRAAHMVRNTHPNVT